MTATDPTPVPSELDERLVGNRYDLIFSALGAASTCWETLDNAGVFDSDRAKRIGDEVLARLAEMDEAATLLGTHGTETALLGLATTRELLDELGARIGDVHATVPGPFSETVRYLTGGGLDDARLNYRTVDA